MKQQDLEIIMQDFGKVAEEVKKFLKQKRKGTLLWDSNLSVTTIYENGMAWFNMGEGDRSTPIGKPEDYLQIRDNYQNLKEFLGNLLDKGILYWGTSYWNQDGETNTADYAVWLYRNCENQEFKQNFERAVVELTEEELERKFTPLDFKSAFKKEKENFEKVYKGDINQVVTRSFNREDIRGALSRARLEYNVSEEDQEFKEYFIKELSKTERPITLEEYVSQFRGEPKKLEENYKSGEPTKRYKRVHFDETSPEFKEAYKKWYLQKQAKGTTISEFKPQFNRLIGLLDTIIGSGKNKELIKLYPLLEKKAKQGFFKDAPDLPYYFSGANIYNYLLVVLTALQPDPRLKEFWLDNIRNDKNTGRVLTSVHGLLSSYNTKKDRKKQIPAILEKLQERGYDTDKTQYHESCGFIFDENLLERIIGCMGEMCFGRARFFHLNKKANAIDFLQKREFGNGNYSFIFERYTTKGNGKLEATYDLAKDTVNGHTEVGESIREYFKEGFELPKRIWVTSLEGRKINRTKTQLVDNNGEDMKGFYEGIVGLNHNHFPFFYDPSKKEIRLANPIESRCVLFGVRGDWEKNRIGLEKVEKKIPHKNFLDLNKMGEKIIQITRERKEKGYLGDSIYALGKGVSDKIAPHLTTIIDTKLIREKDGLVEIGVRK